MKFKDMLSKLKNPLPPEAKTDKAKADVWFVTGASSGIGMALCLELLGRGFKVAAASRNTAQLENMAQNHAGALLPLSADVTDGGQIKNAVSKTLEHFGKIDVVVNNAAVSSYTSTEESVESDEKYLFEVNFWGAVRVVKETLPHLRARKSGLIINISSVSGLTAFKGTGYYAASKHALEGFSQSLSEEIKPLGIGVLIVEPGIVKTPISQKIKINYPAIEEYKAIFKDAIEYLENDVEYKTAQGSPEKTARAIIDVACLKTRPLRLLLNALTYDIVTDKLEKDKEEFLKYKAYTLRADYAGD
ncbi:MAG: SDR family oxidoreductase [Elusimicrobiota bacterium]|jgi:NAD(P)-dependent dehydrogenase (short-subunit alcohol dehydrogenase family)|nr:SDR family oxidoreductase [Elusimicrobiota bacterium]